MPNNFIFTDWTSKLAEAHRRGISDMAWAQMQPEGAPNYSVGDVVEFQAGGFGAIKEVSEPHYGWPSSYATEPFEDLPQHPSRKSAWHYEGDFKRLVAKKTLEWL